MTEAPSALRRWMVAGPEVCHVVAEYEAVSEAKDEIESSHHHKTEQAQRVFLEKVEKLYPVMKMMGNTFQEET